MRFPRAARQVLLCAATTLVFGAARESLSATYSPIVTSPSNPTYVFGAEIPFTARDLLGHCQEGASQYLWYFRRVGAAWPAVGFRFDDPDRMLGNALIPKGCSLTPGPGGVQPAVPGAGAPCRYEARVEMCGATSPTQAFDIVYAPNLVGEDNPIFSDNPAYCFMDWNDTDVLDLNGDGIADDLDGDGVPDPIPLFNHATTAHFNLFWQLPNTSLCRNGPALTAAATPSVQRLELLECVWATLTRSMRSPLSNQSIFRDEPGFESITKLPYVVGTGEMGGNTDGGGQGEIQGFGNGIGAQGSAASWVPVHELFHVFDYAGNPLHERRRDYRYENEPYHFFHESVTRVEQTMSPAANKLWGYRTDEWPIWAPLDPGLLLLDYDAGVFWSYAINHYSFGSRKHWRGPSIDACQQYAVNAAGTPLPPPHDFKFFEAWNATVRTEVTAALRPGQRLADYVLDECPSDIHYGPQHAVSDPLSIFYNGALFLGHFRYGFGFDAERPCLQTLRTEIGAIEQVARLSDPDWRQTMLRYGLLVDFGVKFAQSFPPDSLLAGMPVVVSCEGLTDVHFSRGFDNPAPPSGCPGSPPLPPVMANAPVCAAVWPHDFYARIELRLRSSGEQWLRLRANDDATLYVDGRARINRPDPWPVTGRQPYLFHAASTTFADPRFQWSENHVRQSSFVPIEAPERARLEIEWVNRGDGRGNADGACAADRSRYLLELERLDGFDLSAGTLVTSRVPDDEIEVVKAEFWPLQGSGNPYPPVPDGTAPLLPPNATSATAAKLGKEIQLRPVSGGRRPFLLPAMGVHYHPVACPDDRVGPIEVTVKQHVPSGLGGWLAFADGTWDSPEAQLLAVKAPAAGGGRATVDPRGRGTLIPNQLAERFTLDCAQAGQTATHAGDPAFVMVVAGPWPFIELGAIHYSVLVGDPAQDLDGDLVPDYRDDCIARANPDQHDFDGDGYGDACDADFDQDGVVNFRDLALMKAEFFKKSPRYDLDSNGVVNFADLALLKQSFFRAPGPSSLAP